MSDALTYVENQVLSFSLAEQLHLLSFIADAVNKKASTLSEEEAVWENVKNDSW